MTTVHVQKIGHIDQDQGLLDQAISFFNAGSRCLSDICITPLRRNAPMTPAVTCLAFSLELYFKLLILLKTGEKVKGHKLKDLYDQIPDEIRTQICTKYGPSLEGDLENVSNSFIEWRYEHEYEALMVNPQIFVKICTICHELVKSLKPELKIFGENTC